MSAYENASSPDLERAVLSVLLDGRHKQAWAKFEQHCQTIDVFHVTEHKYIAKAIAIVAMHGKEIDAISVNEALGQIPFRDILDRTKWRLHSDIDLKESMLARMGGGNAVIEILNSGLGSVSGYDQNCKLLADYHLQRQLIDVLQAKLAEAQMANGRTRAAEIGDTAINETSRILGGQASSQTMADHMGMALAMHDKRQTAGADAPAASWGVPRLDHVVPLKGGRLITLAALTGRGKTSLALQACYATVSALGPFSVALLSREIPGPALASTFIAREIGSTKDAIERGMLTPDQRAAAEDVRQRWVGMEMAVKDSMGSCSPSSVEMWARQRHVRSGGRLALVVVDYLQLLDSEKPDAKEYDKLVQATRAMKRISVNLNVCVLMLSQMSRKADEDNREPRLSDLHGSSSIEKDSDVAMFLWSAAPMKGPRVIVNVLGAKNRHGDQFDLKLHWDRPSGHLFREHIENDAPAERKHHSATPQDSEDLFK